MAYIRVACALAVVFVAFQFANSLDCYVCLTKDQCANNNSNTNMTCPGNNQLCLQISNKDDDVIIRGCGTQDDCDVYAYCSSCEDNLCNSSPTVLPTILTFTVVTAVLARFYLV